MPFKLPSRTTLLAVVVLQSAIIFYIAPSPSSVFSLGFWRSLHQISLALDLTHRNYVDPGKAGFQDLGENAVRGILIGLDPYSSFFTSREFKDFNVTTEQAYQGIGVEVSQLSSGIFIVNVFNESPASKQGLQVGDRLLSVDGESTEGKNLPWVVERIRGLPNTEVVLTLLRPLRSEPITATVTRAPISFNSIDRLQQHPNGIVSMRIRHFGVQTSRELATVLEEANKNGVETLLIDLRGNPGGLLSAARDAVDLFVEPGEVVVMTVNRSGEVIERLLAKRSPLAFQGSIYLLQDRTSASAAEIFSGAMRQLVGARIFGEPSFGKGSVQGVFQFRNGAAIKLTTQLYTLPDGTPVDGRGVTPDFPLEMEENTLFQAEISRKFLHLSAEEFEEEFGFERREDAILSQTLAEIQLQLASPSSTQ
ncbi:MAG: S41 family peptidase [Puniceicoccaceae bacterium]